MDNRLMIALFNSCRFASERKGKIYAKEVVIGNHSVATVITVNNFGGGADWHISAQIIKSGRPVNIFAKIDRAAAKKIADYLMNFLADVGRGPIRQNNSITEFNYYKMLADDERQRMK
jgi:hypothetical protein